MNEQIKIVAIENKGKKYKLLILGIIFDLIGMFSYIFPGIGEYVDFIWAPIAGFLLIKMYKGNTGKIAGLIGFIEEALPFSDIIPTFTITWIYTYVFNNKLN
jgi:hypothetical protein